VTVYLLGAGPGDPGLLTLRGGEVLAEAQVVIYDRLSQGAVLNLAPDSAELINVGKLPGQPRLSQPEINQLLVDKGKALPSVVRLKGGDPLVFARGGEEAKALLDAGVDFEIIPGVSSAFAVPAYAGIPATLRHSATSVTILTGHEAEQLATDQGLVSSVNWEAAAQLAGTLVILMGVANWSKIAERLLRAGMPPNTPAAAISWGTRPNQHTIRSSLQKLEQQPLQAPSVIVVGEVAGQDLAWFEKMPLFGRKVAVTRPADQSAELVARLRRQGAEPVEIPLLEIKPPADAGARLAESLELLKTGHYSWVVFTSANGVRKFLEITRDARDFGSAKVAAIGPSTAKVLAGSNILADLVPPRFVAESLLEKFPNPPSGPGRPARVLIARAETARDTLPQGLVAKGWEVEVVPAYRTVGLSLTAADAEALVNCDVITLLSPSAVTQFKEQCQGLTASPPPTMPQIACIGPITASAARNAGLPVAVEASVYTAEGLVAALRQHFADSV